MLGKVVTKMGAMVQAQGMLYKVIIQPVLLYGRNSWVVIGIYGNYPL